MSDDVKRWIEDAALLAGGVVPLPKYQKDLPSFDLRLLSENTDVSATFENLVRLTDEYKRQTIPASREHQRRQCQRRQGADAGHRLSAQDQERLQAETSRPLRILARCFCVVNQLPGVGAHLLRGCGRSGG